MYVQRHKNDHNDCLYNCMHPGHAPFRYNRSESMQNNFTLPSFTCLSECGTPDCICFVYLSVKTPPFYDLCMSWWMLLLRHVKQAECSGCMLTQPWECNSHTWDMCLHAVYREVIICGFLFHCREIYFLQ